MRYKIIPDDTIKNIIDFLDEIQFEANISNTTEDMQKVNFCNWAINELLNSLNVIDTKDFGKNKKNKKRNDIIDEHFIDWELPDMSDREFEKLVGQFDKFLKGWEKEYSKNNKSKSKSKSKSKKDNKSNIKINPNVVETMSLDEIKEYLLDDPELNDHERFELYYEEYERVNNTQKGYTYEELFKGTGIKPPKKK